MSPAKTAISIVFNNHIVNSNNRLFNYTNKEIEKVFTRRNITMYILLAIFTLFHSSLATARSKPAGENGAQLGLVIANIQTSVGQKFSQDFLNFWRELPNTGNLDLSIDERVDAMNGPQISIYFSGSVVFKTGLSTRSLPSASMGEEACKIVHQRILAQLLQKSQWLDPDLAPDEW